MKSLFLSIALGFTAIAGFAQDSTSRVQLSNLLTTYFSIKDGLVADKPEVASVNAEEFVRVAKGIDHKIIAEEIINAMIKDAGAISQLENLEKQRDAFVRLSNNMIAVAKTVTLNNAAIYQQYCPMKDASWLSNEKGIKNPYYGSEMLTCGQVKGIVQPKTKE